MEIDVVKMHILSEIGITVLTPVVYELLPLKHYHYSYIEKKCFELRKKLYRKDRILNWILKFIFIPLFIIICFLIILFISTIPILNLYGILIGIFMAIVIIFGSIEISEIINDFEIVSKYYFKHRKFKQHGMDKSR